MSTHPNHRLGEGRKQDNGPHWENSGARGPDAPSVARARASYRDRRRRADRRTAKQQTAKGTP